MLRDSVRLDPAVESDSFEFLQNYPSYENLVSFQIPIGLPAPPGNRDLRVVPFDERDVSPGTLYLGQLRGRTMPVVPVAAARFADQLVKALEQRFN